MIGFRTLGFVACRAAAAAGELATTGGVGAPLGSVVCRAAAAAGELVTTGGVGAPCIWANAAQRAGHRIALVTTPTSVIAPAFPTDSTRMLTKPMLLRMIPDVERAAATQDVAVSHLKSAELTDLLAFAHIVAHEIDTLYVTCPHYVVGTSALLCQVFANAHERGARIPLYIYQGKTKNWFAWSGGLATPPRPQGYFAGLSHFPNMHEVEVQGVNDLFS